MPEDKLHGEIEEDIFPGDLGMPWLDKSYRMINTNMERSDLIETISKCNSGLDTFYFEMKDTLEITTAYEDDYNGKKLSAREYPSVQITSHFT